MNPRPLTALVIDDSPTLALQMQQLLQEFNIEAQVATGAAELQDAPNSFSVIFIELVQGSGNGFHMLRTLAGKVGCPLVLLTGTARKSDHAWARQAGAAAVLQRPLSRAYLAHCLQELALLPLATAV